MKKLLATHGVSLGKEFGKLVETLGLAGLLGRIRFHGIGQLDLGHDVLRRAWLVDLAHQPNLFAHRVVNRKILVPNLIQGIGNGMFQECIRGGQACLEKRLHRPAVPYSTESHRGQPALTSITRIKEPNEQLQRLRIKPKGCTVNGC